MIPPLSHRKQVRQLVEEARVCGPKQPWRESPRKPRLFDRFDYRRFTRDPKEAFAPEIAQSFADGALEAWEAGFVDIAYLRARTAADREQTYCETPGIYQRLLQLIARLAEEHGREKKGKPMTEAEQLRDIRDKLHDIAGTSFGLKRYKVAKILIGAIESISAELNPKGEQLPLEMKDK